MSTLLNLISGRSGRSGRSGEPLTEIVAIGKLDELYYGGKKNFVHHYFPLPFSSPYNQLIIDEDIDSYKILGFFDKIYVINVNENENEKIEYCIPDHMKQSGHYIIAIDVPQGSKIFVDFYSIINKVRDANQIENDGFLSAWDVFQASELSNVNENLYKKADFISTSTSTYTSFGGSFTIKQSKDKLVNNIIVRSNKPLQQISVFCDKYEILRFITKYFNTTYINGKWSFDLQLYNHISHMFTDDIIITYPTDENDDGNGIEIEVEWQSNISTYEDISGKVIPVKQYYYGIPSKINQLLFEILTNSPVDIKHSYNIYDTETFPLWHSLLQNSRYNTQYFNQLIPFKYGINASRLDGLNLIHSSKTEPEHMLLVGGFIQVNESGKLSQSKLLNEFGDIVIKYGTYTECYNYILSKNGNIEGYFYNEHDHAGTLNYPRPQQQLTKFDEHRIERIEQILSTMNKLGYLGSSSCRICHKSNGSIEYNGVSPSGKLWYIPQGYIHYLKEHNVHPSSQFIDDWGI